MKKEMSCCMSEHTQDNSTIQKISPLRCGCFLSKGTPSQNPAHASPLISQQSFEITVKKSDTIALHSKGVFGRDNLVAWKSDLFYHQKVSSHTKIYSLIESYLI
ncbi:MAG: hypothetical protein ACE5IR_04130 [bacterium]